MKVVQVNFALHLELVYEIEKAESKGSAGAMPGGWKPADVKKLGMRTVGSLLDAVSTKTVGDLNRVDAGSIKEYEIGWLRGKGALIIDNVAELIGCA